MSFVLQDLVKEKFISVKIMEMKRQMEIADEIQGFLEFIKIAKGHQKKMNEMIDTFFNLGFQSRELLNDFVRNELHPMVIKSNEFVKENPIINFLMNSLIDRSLIKRPCDEFFPELSVEESEFSEFIKEDYLPYSRIVLECLEAQNKSSKQINLINRILRIQFNLSLC